MKHREKIPSFRLLILITTPKLADKAAEMFRKGSLPVQYRLNAEGTASSEIMDMLGLGSIDKRILISILPKHFAEVMLDKLKSELKLGIVNSGIAITIPLTGINNLILQMLMQINDEKFPQEEGRDEEDMAEIKHALIAAIVNRGFGSEVMAAAKEAGANGGTVVHSRQIGNEEVRGFWGLSVQDEKEIVLILSKAEDKMGIMKKINEHCGVSSDAQGMIMSIPVDMVMGYSSEK